MVLASGINSSQNLNLSLRHRGGAVELQRRVLQTAVSVHLLQLQLVDVEQTLGFQDRLLLGEQPADLHEGLVFRLWDYNVNVDGDRETNCGEHQVAVGPGRHLMVEETREQRDEFSSQSAWTQKKGKENKSDFHKVYIRLCCALTLFLFLLFLILFQIKSFCNRPTHCSTKLKKHQLASV